MNNGCYYKKLARKRHALCLNIVALWRQIVINDCLKQLIFSNTSASFSICVLIVLLRVSRSKYILFGKVCGKELYISFGRRWIHKGLNVYLYFMIFYNINNVCNNCHFISFSDLRSSKNEIDSAGRPNSWRGDRILKQFILRKCDSEDIKRWTIPI